jgi:hypothetical protein
LRRIKKQEWGWITVPLISILFAAAFFLFAFARRPTHIGLDEFSFIEMDSLGNKALVSTSVRVSTPVRFHAELTLAGDSVFVGRERQPGLNIDHSNLDPTSETIWEIGPELKWEASLRPLSFENVHFQTVTALSGNVVRIVPTVLQNKSGISFDSAIFVTPQQIYPLDSFPDGSTKDLEKAGRISLSEHAGFNFHWYINEEGEKVILNTGPLYFEGIQNFEIVQKLRSQPFSLLRLVETQEAKDWERFFKSRSALFLGLSTSEPTVRINSANASKLHKTITAIHYY